MRLLTKEVTNPVNADPIITQTAKSNTFPRIIKF